MNNLFAAFWKRNRVIETAVAIAMFCFFSIANATVILNINNGKLVGASNIDIAGVFYDVRFVDNSACHVFGACNYSNGVRDFWSWDTARAAGQALLDQVFIDSPLGAFDSNPTLTFGINSLNNNAGNVLIPWSSVWTDCSSQSCKKLGVAVVVNLSGTGNDYVLAAPNPATYSVDPLTWNNTSGDILGGSPSPSGVFADFSLAASPPPAPQPTPEPSVLGLLSIGLLWLMKARIQRRTAIIA